MGDSMRKNMRNQDRTDETEFDMIFNSAIWGVCFIKA